MKACSTYRPVEGVSGARRAHRVLSDVSLTLKVGDSVSIVGPSGSGKSTLLYILGARAADIGDGQARRPEPLRSRRTGPRHVSEPPGGLRVPGAPLVAAVQRARERPHPDAARERPERLSGTASPRPARRVGLGPRLHHRPHQLSGGEKQRVALARALVQRPQLVLCDEPTGNLDHESAESVMSLLLALHATQPTILVVVTHNLDFAGRFAAIAPAGLSALVGDHREPPDPAQPRLLLANQPGGDRRCGNGCRCCLARCSWASRFEAACAT